MFSILSLVSIFRDSRVLSSLYKLTLPNLEQGPGFLRLSHILFKPAKLLLISTCAYMVPKSFHTNWAIRLQGDITQIGFVRM
jgi:hypothetical protein